MLVYDYWRIAALCDVMWLSVILLRMTQLFRAVDWEWFPSLSTACLRLQEDDTDNEEKDEKVGDEVREEGDEEDDSDESDDDEKEDNGPTKEGLSETILKLSVDIGAMPTDVKFGQDSSILATSDMDGRIKLLVKSCTGQFA